MYAGVENKDMENAATDRKARKCRNRIFGVHRVLTDCV